MHEPYLPVSLGSIREGELRLSILVRLDVLACELGSCLPWPLNSKEHVYIISQSQTHNHK